MTPVEFFSKYALGGLTRPSCLLCGKIPADWPPAIQHAELPDIIICTGCVGAARRGSVALSMIVNFEPRENANPEATIELFRSWARAALSAGIEP